MEESDSTTVGFSEAVAAFAAVSGRVRALRLEGYQLQTRAEVVDAEIREREREVADSAVVQVAPAEGPHNVEARADRTIEILMSDGEHVARIEEANRLQHAIAMNDAYLEHARDQRMLERRRMDFAIAITGAER